MSVENSTNIFKFLSVRNGPLRPVDDYRRNRRRFTRVGELLENYSVNRRSLNRLDIQVDNKQQVIRNRSDETVALYLLIHDRLKQIFDRLWRVDDLTYNQICNAMDNLEQDCNLETIIHIVEDVILLWHVQNPPNYEMRDEAIRFYRMLFLRMRGENDPNFANSLDHLIRKVTILLPRELTENTTPPPVTREYLQAARERLQALCRGEIPEITPEPDDPEGGSDGESETISELEEKIEELTSENNEKEEEIEKLKEEITECERKLKDLDRKLKDEERSPEVDKPDPKVPDRDLKRNSLMKYLDDLKDGIYTDKAKTIQVLQDEILLLKTALTEVNSKLKSQRILEKEDTVITDFTPANWKPITKRRFKGLFRRTEISGGSNLRSFSMEIPYQTKVDLSHFTVSTQDIIKVYVRESLEIETIRTNLKSNLSTKYKQLQNHLRSYNKRIIIGKQLVYVPFGAIDHHFKLNQKFSKVKTLEMRGGSQKYHIQYARPDFYAGIADLKIVRETLVAYELYDIAHIENVLAGEEKERTHRRLESTEIEEILLTETEEETEKDTQTTTKNEIANEAANTASQLVTVEGSLTVTGSYGPSVSFEANVSGGYTGETTSSIQKSSSFAQEVTEKTTETIRQRMMEQITTRTLTEIEETNLHAVRNAYPGSEHIRGIYRWLNKVSEAQVYNYGARHMFSFMIPEPSAFYLWIKMNSPSDLIEPEFPKIRSWNGMLWINRNLEPTDLTAENYSLYVSQYAANGVMAPPNDFRHVVQNGHKDSEVHANDGDSDGYTYKWSDTFNKKVSHKINIPDGYYTSSYWAYLQYGALGYSNHSSYYTLGNVSGNNSTLWAFMNEIPFGISFSEVMNYYYTLFIKCYIDEDSSVYRDWQLHTFEAVVDGYNKQKSEYEEKLAVLAINEGIAIEGNNPLTNEKIIKHELQRYCLSQFTQTDMDQFLFFFQSLNETSDDWWKLDHNPLYRTYKTFIMFMERAFEWENMTYLLYPYFWGRESQWSKRVVELGDPDPNMLEFLQAGAARVLVPARPEFAEALLYYNKFGVLPDGAEVLLTAEDAIEAMIEEVRNQGIDSIPGATPEGDPWEIRIPTALTLLQDPTDIEFRDPLAPGGIQNVGFPYADIEPNGSNGNGNGNGISGGEAGSDSTEVSSEISAPSEAEGESGEVSLGSDTSDTVSTRPNI